MAKEEQKKTNTLMDQQNAYNNAYRNDELAYQRGQRDIATNRQEEMYRPQIQGYTELSQTGGLTDADRERLRNLQGLWDPRSDEWKGLREGVGGGMGSIGGPNLEAWKNNPNQWNELEGLYRDSITGKTVNTDMLRSGRPYLENIAKSGGYTPEFLQSIGRNMGMLDDIATSGGVSGEGINRIRGNGVFDEFAQTGGYSDYDKANIRNRATSSIPAYYDNLRRDAAQQARIGNSSIGQAALASRMGRDAAREISGATRDAELGIMDRVNEGRQWGAGNLSQAEAGLANLQSQNRLNALGLSTNTQRGMQEFMAGMQSDAGKWLSESEIPINEMQLKERQYGIGGLDEITQRRIAEEKEALASRNAAASADYGARAAAYGDANKRLEDYYGRVKDWSGSSIDMEQGMLDFAREGRMGGLEGLTNLYGTTPAEVAMRENIIGSNRGQEGQLTGAGIGQKAAYNPNVSAWDRATQIIGATAPIAGAAMGGFGGPANTNARVDPRAYADQQYGYYGYNG